MQWTRGKKVAAALGVTAALVAGSGVAFAYFTSTGSGTTSGTVAGAQTLTWSVTFPGPNVFSAGSALYPGTTETFPITVTNTGNGHQGLTTLTATLKTNGSDVADAAGADIPGCLSAWWTVSATHPASVEDIAPNGTDTAQTATLTFVNSTTVDQGACQGKTPGFTVAAS